MDYNLDLIISETFLKIRFKSKTFWWGGMIHECEPKRFFIDDKIEFIEATHGAIYDILIGETSISQPVLLTIDRQKYSVEEVVQSEEIVTLFRNICKTKFELYLWKDDESIDIEYEFNSDMDIGEILKNTISEKVNIMIKS